MQAWDIFAQNFDLWREKPLGAVAAVVLGIIVGYLLSRIRHQGKIDALEERIKHKAEQIEVKDKTIASLSTTPQSLGHARTTDARPLEFKNAFPDLEHGAVIPLTANKDQAVKDTITRIQYKFVFNPQTGYSKILTFIPGGGIGEGRNSNETSWRVKDGKVEIFNSRGDLYSRFNVLDDGITLHHTNDPDTKSIRGQYMIPIPIDLPFREGNLQR